MSNFIVNTDIPNLRVVIREGDQYNINIVPGRITTLVTGSFTSYADMAGMAASASYVSGAGVFAQFATSASYALTAETINVKTVIEDQRFSVAFISGSDVSTDVTGHFKFNPTTHILSISGSTGSAGGIAGISPRTIFVLSGSEATVINPRGIYTNDSGEFIGIAGKPSRLVDPYLPNKQNPGIIITSESALASAYVPIEFQGSGSYTDGRVTVNTPLVAKQGVEVTGSTTVTEFVKSNEYRLNAGTVSIVFTGSINQGIFGVTEYVKPYISTTEYSGMTVEYLAQRPGACRMGIIMASWLDTASIVFTDISTTDIGDTSDISFRFLSSSNELRLRVNSEGTGTGAWTVQSLFKLFPNLNS